MNSLSTLLHYNVPLLSYSSILLLNNPHPKAANLSILFLLGCGFAPRVTLELIGQLSDPTKGESSPHKLDANYHDSYTKSPASLALSFLSTSLVFSVPDLVPVRVEKFKATKLYLYTRDSLEPPGPCRNTGLPQADGSNEEQSFP